MFKILYIAHNHPPLNDPLQNMGGMQRVSMQLVDEIKKRDDVEIKTIINHTPWKGIEWRTAIFLTKLFFKLPSIVRKEKPDVILFSSMVTASLAGMTEKKINVPMVTINHGHDVKMQLGIYQKYLPKVFDALSGVISVSSATREECIKRGMDPSKGVALPNGFNLEEFNIDIEKEQAREKLEKTFDISIENKHLLITVGRQVKRKGHEWFITEILPKITSDFVYLAIGDGPEHEKLKEIRDNSDQKEQIILAGRQPDEILNYTYAAGDLFIMPNIPVEGDMEGFGIVLLEANLAETPAIASDLEGIRDVITNGENGYKIEVGNSDVFASKIDQVLANEIKNLSVNARQFVLKNFNWSKVAEDYILYLQKVSSKQSR